MGAFRQTSRAACVALVLCAGARAAAEVQVDPIARLSLEGGYDSNPLYNGQGGEGLGRLSPEFGVDLRNHTWDFRAVAGGDLLAYPQRSNTVVWNQRGQLVLHARPGERWKVDGDAGLIYAFDPLGLARLGIFAPAGTSALVAGGRVKAGYRLDHAWTLSGLLDERVVRYENGTGAASHSPGVELTNRVMPRLELGGLYKFDFFQGLGPGAGDAYAHELQAVARYRIGRRMLFEGTAGAAFWTGTDGRSSLVPQASVQLLSLWRAGGGLRLTARHGVGLGLTATPGLFDALEAGVTTRVARRFQFHVDGGFWRSGDIPWGANAVLGYGFSGSFDFRVTDDMLIGVGASRFDRLDASAPQYQRNTVGLHVTWELHHRRGEP